MHVRALGRPNTPAVGSYTGVCALGAQRGLQRALAPYGPISVRTRAHARARDSTHSGDCRDTLCVSHSMCQDTACVSKATKWWEMPIVSIWWGVGFRRWGPIVATVGKGADKVYYDILVGRRSTYWGILRWGILVRAQGEINVTSLAGARRRNRMLSTTGRGTRV